MSGDMRDRILDAAEIAKTDPEGSVLTMLELVRLHPSHAAEIKAAYAAKIEAFGITTVAVPV